MICALLENNTIIYATSYGDMLEKAHAVGQRVRKYYWE